MDLSNILYLFGFIILALGLIVGVVYLMKRYNVKPEELSQSIDISKTITTVVKLTAKELKFGTNDEIEKVADIVIDSLDYVKLIANDKTKQEKINAGVKYIQEMSFSFGIEMNEDRLFIVTTLFTLGMNLLESLEVK
jgi:hypothetical protein